MRFKLQNAFFRHAYAIYPVGNKFAYRAKSIEFSIEPVKAEAPIMNHQTEKTKIKSSIPAFCVFRQIIYLR
ncbi:hypothetical protein DDZ15_10920 [Rhodohalobacter mucosus]|uniref:Uncharacterized protein n=1 Tax=Rhodohalobacter mucosus TaxID=2079485 RepID=A0A316TTM6_9BACT|nr:hypothetical protein DDZ15_10920 [Rhodohalobacter mucosus]